MKVPHSIRGARHAPSPHRPNRWELAAILDDAVLATDELFADAVRHASADPADTIAVVLECSERELRVTLADPTPPRPRTVGPGSESGRGPAVVAALADDWGTDPPEPGAVGKKVWFSLAVREPM
ncbi:ATP-binding protein [Streptomyces sp. CA-210063]|uniref:ATP-binding protein n=1 Tax=Streptomyces sp. CA-210063 TaxID=2801029 RepID=UPI00214C4D71|nr:ATP-binding protein [Streptomyces sp. CA-210063]UUU36404.1 ATP-binding protein [Streptomyces sp. CA-210063]